MKRKITIAIVTIIVLGIGFFMGYMINQKSYNQKIDQYKKIIDYYFPVVESTNSVTGKVLAIGNDYLNIETVIQDPYVLPEERETKTIKILISGKTKITRFDAMTGRDVEIKITDLKTNDQIGAFSDADIRNRSEFEAKSINLYVAP